MCKGVEWTKQNNENKQTKEGPGVLRTQSQISINPTTLLLSALSQRQSVAQPSWCFLLAQNAFTESLVLRW